MILNTYLSLQHFSEGWNTGTFTLPAVHLIHAVPQAEYDYGLSILRQSIARYEQIRQVPLESSKQAMPFFRENRRMLVGPEVEMYILRMYEAELPPERLPYINTPLLQLSLDYELLAEHCLRENLYLIRCKYNEEGCRETFLRQMEHEYDKFFYDDEHTGFTSDSRFFSLLCNACMEVKQPVYAGEKEWDIALFRQPEEADYSFMEGKFTPFTPVTIPIECIKRIAMPGRHRDALSFSALAGFLRKKGLYPELYLEGLLEDTIIM